MRTITKLFAAIGLVAVSALMLAANAAGQEAKILKIVGPGAQVVTAAGTQDAREQMGVPLNATIKTNAAEVYLEVFSGVVVTVKRQSEVVVSSLTGQEPALNLRSGSVISQIDRTRIGSKVYSVRTPKGVAAARGTSFTVAVGNGLTIATTADSVTFTIDGGQTVTIQAGMVSITPAGGTTPLAAVPLATAAAQNPEISTMMRDAVQAVSTVVQNNLGSISAETATSLISQVVAVAVAVVPTEAASFTATAVGAVTASGSATANSSQAAATAAAEVTAAAVKSAPDQAGQIAGAAAAAAPAAAGVITAAAQQVAPESAKDSIVQQVASSTGQSTQSVQDAATSAASQAATAVNSANEATSNVVSQPGQGNPTGQPSTPNSTSGNKTTEQGESSPETSIDPSIGVSNSGGRP
jgi:hypothetical protein